MNAQDFGKYQLLKKLATGGMAEVWLARQTGIEGFERLLVVKRILPHLADDPEFVQMFLNEAKIAARFNHPNIAQIYDLGEANGTYFIAMEYIHGEDLGRVMRKAWSAGQWVANPLSIRIVAAACEGLYYAHNKADEAGRPLKVVHRDISPQNILVSFDGSVKVVDFGIAKAADQASMTKSGAIKGKFAYMSPEQAAGKPLDHRSDLFAIGLVLYELLTGVRPLKKDSELATLQAALECAIEPPSAVADVPAELDEVVMRALTRAPEDRYRDARTFQMALEEFLITQRWVAGSVQISELMSTLFADRLEEEKQLGRPNPTEHDGSSRTGNPAAPVAPSEREKSNLSPAADMEWEAPPGETEAKTSSTRSGGRLPRQPRRDSGSQRSTSSPPTRTGSRAEITKSRSDPDDDPMLPLTPTGPRTSSRGAPRRRTVSGAKAPALADPGRTVDLDGEPEPEPEPEREPEPAPSPRRRSSTGAALKRRSASDAQMPPAPPPSKPSPAQARPFPVSHSAVERMVDVDGIKQRAVRQLRLVVVASVVIAVVALGLVFRTQIWDALTHSAADDQGVYLTVNSNPQAKVLVRHPPEEGNRDKLTELGETPLKGVRGAHQRDTLILSNPKIGLYYEEEIPLGEPNKPLKIEKEFGKGALRLTISPKGLGGLSFWRNGQEVGRYSPGLKIELYEGLQKLEVRGSQLKRPYDFEVEIRPNQTVERAMDLSGHL